MPTEGSSRSARAGIAGLGLALLLGPLACTRLLAPEVAEIAPRIVPHPLYEELFPYYVELCAVSQFRSVKSGDGGIPGHAVMYLKGACKDEAAPYPRLRACRHVATRRDDPEHGAGISVNRWVSNVNWLAVPGKQLFFDGNLDEGEVLDQDAFERAKRSALEAGVFEGVRIRPEYPTDLTEPSLEDMVRRHSVATDFALRFSRTNFCARMPVEQEMLGEIVEYLNQINQEYFTGAADYDWSGYRDNCVHLLRNALAAASIWRPISVNQTKFRQLFNLAIPANEMVNLAELGASGPLDDGREVYRSDEARDALLDFDWLPRRHGALIKVLPVHARNELYDTRYRMFALENPLTSRVRARASQLISDPRFTDLEANLEHFRQVYQDILLERDELIAGGLLPIRSIRYMRPAKRYFGYVEAKLLEVERMLEHLSGRSGSSR